MTGRFWKLSRRRAILGAMTRIALLWPAAALAAAMAMGVPAPAAAQKAAEPWRSPTDEAVSNRAHVTSFLGSA